MKDKKYILNHLYRVKDDKKRAFIYSTVQAQNFSPWTEKDWSTILHPILGKLLLLMAQPKSYYESILAISKTFNIPKSESIKLLDLFLNNKENFGLKYKDKTYRIPRNIIIEEAEQKCEPYSYSDNLFSEFKEDDLDIDTIRYIRAPNTLVFMVNNKCVTDCIYCYADKHTNIFKYLPFELVEKFISEAHNLCIKEIMLDGGELFLYPYWKELLLLLKKYQFDIGFISTKMPINRNDLEFLKYQNITIQVSLDSTNPQTLSSILKVPQQYQQHIISSIKDMDEIGVRFQIATVINKFNCTVGNLKGLKSFLETLHNLKGWRIRCAFRSLYSKEDFNNIKASHESIQQIASWINEQHEKSKITIDWDAPNEKKYFASKTGSLGFSGARCSANFSNLFILPDGKVTICEQLYWNPHFIIGDLNNQGIEEIWNSEKALRLANPIISEISDKSPCSKCNIFEICMKFSNRCYADIIKAYGWENTDFPDPRCCYAPPFINDLNT